MTSSANSNLVRVRLLRPLGQLATMLSKIEKKLTLGKCLNGKSCDAIMPTIGESSTFSARLPSVATRHSREYLSVCAVGAGVQVSSGPISNISVGLRESILNRRYSAERLFVGERSGRGIPRPRSSWSRPGAPRRDVVDSCWLHLVEQRSGRYLAGLKPIILSQPAELTRSNTPRSAHSPLERPPMLSMTRG